MKSIKNIYEKIYDLKIYIRLGRKRGKGKDTVMMY